VGHRRHQLTGIAGHSEDDGELLQSAPANSPTEPTPERRRSIGAMKARGVCPKCDGREILRISDEITDQIGSAFSGLAQNAYVCAACGFIEFYAADVEGLRSYADVVRTDVHPFR
jgi:predicted nucleic-acid-binding Zn-ribbon protein